MKIYSRALMSLVACSAQACFAQSNVKIMGSLDLYLGSIRNAGDLVQTKVLQNGGRAGSWFGVEGKEDLGDGWGAGFLLTSYLGPDIGRAGRGGSDGFWSRDANVSLTSPYGSVYLGRLLAPNFLPSVFASPFAGSFQFSPLLIHQTVSLGGGRYQSSAPSDTSWNNALIYTSPTLGGASVSLHYQLGEQDATSAQRSAKNVGASAFYNSGALSLTGFYERAQIGNDFFATSQNLTFAQPISNWMVGGSYNFGPVKLFATYGQAKRPANRVNTSTSTSSIGASIPAGGGAILIAAARTSVDAGNDRSTMSVGYDYPLSKRTGLYAMARHDALQTYRSGDTYGVGIRHRF